MKKDNGNKCTKTGRVLDGIKKRGGFKSLDNAMDSLLLNIGKKETPVGPGI